jgi:hypothetical protein
VESLVCVGQHVELAEVQADARATASSDSRLAPVKMSRDSTSVSAFALLNPDGGRTALAVDERDRRASDHHAEVLDHAVVDLAVDHALVDDVVLGQEGTDDECAVVHPVDLGFANRGTHVPRWSRLGP